MSKCYYIAGKNKGGKYVPCGDVVKNDHYRVEFLERFQSDEAFRTNTLGWVKHPIDYYVDQYNEKGKVPGPNIRKAEQKMCINLYLEGEVTSTTEKTVKIKTEDGSVKTFKHEETCAYDESHDADHLPTDVCKIKGFGEASLLKCMRRRLIEQLSIYTYVGDIVLCLNPYMYLPRMVGIDEFPNVKEYKLGGEPNAYASAHFAYWGQRTPAPSQTNRNQSVIVSGESGAGKTVACGFVMKYLAKLSDWCKMERGEKVGGGEGKVGDITKLVAGVSPFLEAFGNAKTNMNDNSSRFGKFTKIWFSEGEIIGAELEHYLLEKARLCSQGEGERNYHIFYFLCRGGKEDGHTEVDDFKLKDCEGYAQLTGGGSTIVGHGHGPEYDVNRMNAALHEDPDDTGVRAALTNANVSEEVQHKVWQTCAGCLKLLCLEFSAVGATQSKVADDAYAKEVAELLGFDVNNFNHFLCIYRLSLPGGKFADKDCDPASAIDNRNALAKDIYDHIFDWLLDDVCNNVLEPQGEKEAFVGLLDIFGFELMPKNSIEQLCINFANEKLQQLFNSHVFDEEKKVYVREGLDSSVIPPHKDNTPCCNLVTKKSKTFMGAFPTLDDMSSGNHTDKDFVQKLCKIFGKKKGENKKAKTKLIKRASQYFYGDRKKDHIFSIVHFAGDVEYDGREFIAKNKDKLPGQLKELCENSTIDYLKGLYSKKKKKHFKTLASKYLKQLNNLSTTLISTTPRYIRCVKPNDIHFRPVDGAASFDAFKTYRQLLYSGVMEVVKIKKEGFPYRETYESFWKNAVQKQYHIILKLDENLSPREGATELATKVLPKPFKQKNIDGGEDEIHFWACGETLLFGKDTLPEKLQLWHYSVVAQRISDWWRVALMSRPILQFAKATLLLTDRYRVHLARIKYAKVELPVERIQSLVRCIKEYKKYQYLRKRLRAVITIGKAYRKYHIYLLFYRAYKEKVHKNAMIDLSITDTMVVDKVKVKVSASVVGERLKSRLKHLRFIVRLQSHVHQHVAYLKASILLKRLHISQKAAVKAEAVYRLYTDRNHFLFMVYFAVITIQRLVRRVQASRRYKRQKEGTHVLHRFVQMCIMKIHYVRKRTRIINLQRWYRFSKLRESYGKAVRCASKIQHAWRSYLFQRDLITLRENLSFAARKGDIKEMEKILSCYGRFEKLAMIPPRVLLNLRDPRYKTTAVHSVIYSGNVDALRFIFLNGGCLDFRDILGETPFHFAVRSGDTCLPMTRFIHSKTPKIKQVELVNQTNFDGDSPADLARSHLEDDCLNTLLFLIKNGAKTDEEDDDVFKALDDVVKQRKNLEREKMEFKMKAKKLYTKLKASDPLFQLMSIHGNKKIVDRETVLIQNRKYHDSAVHIQRIFRAWRLGREYSTLYKVASKAMKLHQAKMTNLRRRVWASQRAVKELKGEDVFAEYDVEEKSFFGEIPTSPASLPFEFSSEEQLETKRRELSNQLRKMKVVKANRSRENLHPLPRNAPLSMQIRYYEKRCHEKIHDIDFELLSKAKRISVAKNHMESCLAKLQSLYNDWSAGKISLPDNFNIEIFEENGIYRNVVNVDEKKTREDGNISETFKNLDSNLIDSQLFTEKAPVEATVKGATELFRPLIIALQIFETIQLENTANMENVQGWFYPDPKGKIHGPFMTRKIINWFDKGSFSRTQPVRWGDSGNWVPMEDLVSEDEVTVYYDNDRRNVLQAPRQALLDIFSDEMMSIENVGERKDNIRMYLKKYAQELKLSSFVLGPKEFATGAEVSILPNGNIIQKISETTIVEAPPGKLKKKTKK
eukprot:g3995.t1